MVTITLYLPATGNSFVVFDDRDYVTENPYVHDGLSWNTIKWAFTSTAAANWHPLTWLSHALDYQLFALNPAGHHLDSVLIHALNAVLLFLLLAWVTKRVGPSLLVAALFALHPINVESVAWVAERKNVLCTLFFFLAIGAYAWYAQKPEWRRYLLVVALFAAGLMAKPMVITLPFVLLLLDYWPLGRIRGFPSLCNDVPQEPFLRLLREKVPLLLLSALSAVITVEAQRSSHAVRNLHQFPPALRIENAIVSYGMYLWKMVWPARLAALYPHPASALPAWTWSLSGFVLLLVTALVIVFHRKRYLPVGWSWFLGTLIPVIGLVQVGDAAMADRYAYIPLIGIFVMIAWSLDDLAKAKRLPVTWRLIPAMLALSVLGLVTSRQLSCWENEYTLWRHTLAISELNPFAHDAMGAALEDPNLAATAENQDGFATAQTRLEEARQHFERALVLRRQLAEENPAYQPDLADTLVNVADHERSQRQIEDARRHYEEALNIQMRLAEQNPDKYLPNLAMTLNDVGILDGIQNRLEDARRHFEGALAIYYPLAQQNSAAYLPFLGITLNDLGNLDRIQNRIVDARAHYGASASIYRQLAQRDPDQYLPYVARTLFNMGYLDGEENQIGASRAHYQEALTLFRKLSESNNRFAADVARVEARLQELDTKIPSKAGITK